MSKKCPGSPTPFPKPNKIRGVPARDRLGCVAKVVLGQVPGDPRHHPVLLVLSGEGGSLGSY